MLSTSAPVASFLPLRRQCFPPRRISFEGLWPWLWMQLGGWNTATGLSGSKVIFRTVTGSRMKSTAVSLVGRQSPTKTSSPTFNCEADTWCQPGWKKVSYGMLWQRLVIAIGQLKSERGTWRNTWKNPYFAEELQSGHWPRRHGDQASLGARPPEPGAKPWLLQCAAPAQLRPSGWWSCRLRGSRCLWTLANGFLKASKWEMRCVLMELETWNSETELCCKEARALLCGFHV